MIPDEVDIPRTAPPAPAATDNLFGHSAIIAAVNKMVEEYPPEQREPLSLFTLTGVSFALFAPSGSGKTQVAAAVYWRVRALCPWMTGLHAPWMTADWVSQYAITGVNDKHSLKPVFRALADCRLLCIDGLGEEPARSTHVVANLLKSRLDMGRPVILTSRLPLDGQDSLIARYPNIRAALGNNRFVYAAPRSR